MTQTNSITEDSTISIGLTPEEKDVLPGTLTRQAESIKHQEPADAHALWKHAEALSGDNSLYKPIDEEWELPIEEAELILESVGEVIRDLESVVAHTEFRERFNDTLSATHRKLTVRLEQAKQDTA